MTTVDPFIFPLPEGFSEIEGAVPYFENLQRFLNELRDRTGAGTDTIADTEATVVTHAEKLDFVTITQAVDLDALETESAASTVKIDLIATSSPIYVPSNDGTDRTWDANAAAGAIGSPPTQAQVENIRDAVLEISDVVATQARDLAAKNVFDT